MPFGGLGASGNHRPSAYYAAANWGKEVLFLDLTSPEAAAWLAQELPRTDVLLHNFKRADLPKLGLDPEALEDRGVPGPRGRQARQHEPPAFARREVGLDDARGCNETTAKLVGSQGVCVRCGSSKTVESYTDFVHSTRCQKTPHRESARCAVTRRKRERAAWCDTCVR
jgi:hypothetical protein